MTEQEIKKAFNKNHLKKLIREMLQETSKFSKTGKTYRLPEGVTIDEAVKRVSFGGLSQKTFTWKSGAITTSFLYKKWHPARTFYFGGKAEHRPEGWWSCDTKSYLRVYLQGKSRYGRTIEGCNFKEEINRMKEAEILDRFIKHYILDSDYIVINNTAISIGI